MKREIKKSDVRAMINMRKKYLPLYDETAFLSVNSLGIHLYSHAAVDCVASLYNVETKTMFPPYNKQELYVCEVEGHIFYTIHEKEWKE